MTKKCNKCASVKLVTAFSRNRGHADGLNYSCRECAKLYNIAYYKAHAALYKRKAIIWKALHPEAVRSSTLKKKYGITLQQWNEQFARQGNACAICRTTEVPNATRDWVTDHNHKTNSIRGILCRKCNMAIGLLKDDFKIIRRAVMYVKLYNTRGFKSDSSEDETN